MERVVDHRLLRPLAVVGNHIAHRLAAMLGGKRNHRGRAAERRRDRAGVEVVGIPDAHARELLDVAVAVDPARQDRSARGVDLLRGAGQVLGERDDAAAADADIGAEGVRRGHDRAVANDQIEIRHGPDTQLWTRLLQL